jgi:hypothetical protein
LGRAAIAALLRTRRLVTVAQISKVIGPATHNVAEYQALTLVDAAWTPKEKDGVNPDNNRPEIAG